MYGSKGGRAMAKMADGTPLLSAGTLRVLADKLYEKRKNAAREVCDVAVFFVFGVFSLVSVVSR